METRLNKFLAETVSPSRRKADEMILKGLVELDGEVTRQPGIRIDPETTTVSLEGKRVTPCGNPTLLYAMHKPRNCVSTMDDPQNRSKIADFFPPARSRLMPVGRLDYHSEGLLLVTNDGDLANKILRPSAGISKHYFVKIKGIPDKSDLNRVNGKLRLEGHALRRMKVVPIHSRNGKTWLEVVLKEGKNRQIRKVFELIGHRVLKIKRFKIGNIDLGNLLPGQSRLVGKAETEKLLRICSRDEKKKGTFN